MSYEEAATLPQAAILALQGLRGRGGIARENRVLINGASGSVGPFAVQIAKALGAHVTGVCSPKKMDMVRRLGADPGGQRSWRSDDDFPLGVSCLQIPKRFTDLTQRIGTVDHRLDLPSRDSRPDDSHHPEAPRS
jgi:NADPH:quinone reductase-like Zn-dependent oxidoreductase